MPNVDPAPVSYSHWESIPEPDAPPKLSLKAVVQPDGAAGTVVAEATRAVPGFSHPPELLVQRIDLQLAYRRDGIAALLEEGRRPALYQDGEANTGPPN